MEMGEVILTEYFLLLSWTFPFQMYLRDVFEHFGFFLSLCVFRCPGRSGMSDPFPTPRNGSDRRL